MNEQLDSLVMEIFDEIPDDQMDFRDLENWDSMNHMRLILLVEETFGCTLSEDEIVEIVNKRKLTEILKGHGFA